MRVLMVSKALVVGAYQRKLEAIAQQPGVELVCVVPPSWRQDGREQPLERAYTNGYELIVEPIRWNGKFHIFHFPGLGRQLARVQPDLVHVDEEPYNLATFLAIRAARQIGARSLFFTWQNLPRQYPAPFSWIERAVYRQAPRAIAGNAEAAEVLRHKGYRGGIDVIPQFGVDPELFSPERRGDRPPGKPFTVGYLGRLVEEKGLPLLLEAVAGLPGAWRLELYGHGPRQTELVARSRELGIAGQVLIRAPVPSRQVPELLRSFDALVLPSRTLPRWKEQFGRVLVEAMACGVPVVGSTSGEIPNVIGEAGLRFAEGDAAALRARLAELQGSERRRAELGARGRVRVLERFTHEKIARQTVEVYRAME